MRSRHDSEIENATFLQARVVGRPLTRLKAAQRSGPEAASLCHHARALECRHIGLCLQQWKHFLWHGFAYYQRLRTIQRAEYQLLSLAEFLQAVSQLHSNIAVRGWRLSGRGEREPA